MLEAGCRSGERERPWVNRWAPSVTTRMISREMNRVQVRPDDAMAGKSTHGSASKRGETADEDCLLGTVHLLRPTLLPHGGTRIACYCVCLMLKSTLRVRFQGLGADVDEKAKRGQERRKERKLRRRRRKMDQRDLFGQARAFLVWLRQRYVDFDDDDDGGIFRNLSENATAAAAAAEFATILDLPRGRVLIDQAREGNYFRGDDDKQIVQALLENNCDSWKNDHGFVYSLLAWAEDAKTAGHYLPLTYSSSTSEGGARVDMDALRMVRCLGYYSDTFLASRNDFLQEVCSLVASGSIEAATTALTNDLLGENFETVSPQDGGGVEVLQHAIVEAINRRSPIGSHQ